MTDTKAVQIIKTFSKEELKNFGKFSESPYYNSSKDIIKLSFQFCRSLENPG